MFAEEVKSGVESKFAQEKLSKKIADTFPELTVLKVIPPDSILLGFPPIA
jgi:hypothetical protein